jgi:hypothetical protein
MDIQAHRATSGILLEGYVKRRVVELGQALEDRAAIYLDTKFWILCRDCAAGRNNDPAAQERLRRLRELVKAGKAFCPIGESTFFEFLKKGEATARLEMARVVGCSIIACGSGRRSRILFIATQAKPPERTSAQRQTFWNQWAKLLLIALKKKPQVRQQLRTLHIDAALHAAFLWDKTRRFTSNDLYDFEHASAALAYCQVFLTEHALRSTIIGRNISLDELWRESNEGRTVLMFWHGWTATD